MMLDFEGQARRLPEERRRPSSPLRDVAGMTRSFHHVAAAALREVEVPDEELRVLADAWAERSLNSFLSGYASVDDVHRLLPRSRASRDALFSVFELDRRCTRWPTSWRTARISWTARPASSSACWPRTTAPVPALRSPRPQRICTSEAAPSSGVSARSTFSVVAVADGILAAPTATVQSVQPATSPTCDRHPDRVAGVRCQRCEAPICPSCMVQASVGLPLPGVRRCPPHEGGHRRAAFGRASDPIVTKVIIGLNVAVYLVMVATGGDISGGSGPVYNEGATFGPLIASGEWYRLVSGSFLHSGFLHLAMNMLLLWLLGQVLEPALGRAQFALVYVVSLLGGGLGIMLHRSRRRPPSAPPERCSG